MKNPFLTILSEMAKIEHMKAHSSSRRALVRREQEVATFEKQRSVRSSPRTSYTATEAKNEFGHVLDEAMRGTTVIITKHDSPKAVLLSVDRFHALNDAPQLHLQALSQEFDELLAQMQTTKARRGMEAAFRASPKELGKAAVAAARKRA
jgi:antitoxin Phd